MSRIANFHLILLIAIAVHFITPRSSEADNVRYSPQSAEVHQEEVVTICIGMTMKQVEWLLREKPACFGFGPNPPGPENSSCWYLQTHIIIRYEEGRVVDIQKGGRSVMGPVTVKRQPRSSRFNHE